MQIEKIIDPVTYIERCDPGSRHQRTNDSYHNKLVCRSDVGPLVDKDTVVTEVFQQYAEHSTVRR